MDRLALRVTLCCHDGGVLADFRVRVAQGGGQLVGRIFRPDEAAEEEDGGAAGFRSAAPEGGEQGRNGDGALADDQVADEEAEAHLLYVEPSDEAGRPAQPSASSRRAA